MRDERSLGGPVLQVRGLRASFRTPGQGRVRVLDGVSFDLHPARTLGVVGVSGSGKTTLARCILRLKEPDAGLIRVNGRDFRALRGRALRHARREIQFVFQDARSALDPRLRISKQVMAGLRDPDAGQDLIVRLLERVGLDEATGQRWPHELSGGECQRAALARALATDPDVLVLDEPVSALDVSVQAQVLDLLLDLQQERGLACLFISHDLAVVETVAHEVAVIDGGRVVETGEPGRVLADPGHAATRALVAAAGGFPGPADSLDSSG